MSDFIPSEEESPILDLILEVLKEKPNNCETYQNLLRDITNCLECDNDDHNIREEVEQALFYASKIGVLNIVNSKVEVDGNEGGNGNANGNPNANANTSANGTAAATVNSSEKENGKGKGNVNGNDIMKRTFNKLDAHEEISLEPPPSKRRTLSPGKTSTEMRIQELTQKVKAIARKSRVSTGAGMNIGDVTSSQWLTLGKKISLMRMTQSETETSDMVSNSSLDYGETEVALSDLHLMQAESLPLPRASRKRKSTFPIKSTRYNMRRRRH